MTTIWRILPAEARAWAANDRLGCPRERRKPTATAAGREQKRGGCTAARALENGATQKRGLYSASGMRWSGRLMHEVVNAELSGNHLELSRRLVEVEGVVRRGRARIAGRQGRKPEGLLDKLQDAAVLVVRVRNMAVLGICRNDQHRNAHPEAVVVQHFGATGSYQPP